MASLQLVLVLLGLLVVAAAHGSSNSGSISDSYTEHSHGHGHGHHSCSHRHHDDDVSVHDHRPRLLPEEIAEEEDLKRGTQDDEPGLSTRELWMHAMGSALLVSMASLVCIALLAVTGGKRISPVLVDALAAFGGGAMMGDAFLHQLPHAFGTISHDHHHHDHNESHSHSMAELQVGLSVLGGIILFFLIEKIVRYVEETSAHRHRQDDVVKDKTDSEEKRLTESVHKEQGTGRSSGQVHSHASIPVLGLLNLFTDGVHNLTDGIALGAAFLAYGTKGGWYRAWFLLCHELPQEVGDFGILVRSGFTAVKALAFNFLSALLAVAGAALVLLIGGDCGNSSLIEGFTAGGFLYISLAGVLPEMHQKGTTLKHSAIQLTALGCGVGAAVILSLTE